MKGYYREITEAEMEENRRIFAEDNSKNDDDDYDEEKEKPTNRRTSKRIFFLQSFFEDKQGQYIKMAEIEDYLSQSFKVSSSKLQGSLTGSYRQARS